MRTKEKGIMWKFSAILAKNHGLEEAVFCQYLYERLREAYKQRNQRKRREEICLLPDGTPWIPRTLIDYCKELPFWSEKQIRRILASCKRKGLIASDYLEPNPMDRRLWYTLKGVTIYDWGE